MRKFGGRSVADAPVLIGVGIGIGIDMPVSSGTADLGLSRAADMLLASTLDRDVPMQQTADQQVDLVRGQLLEQSEGRIVLGLPGTDYQIHLRVTAPIQASPTGTVGGRIHARAQRVDPALDNRGGAYIEPIYGRPRRLQGRIAAVDPRANAITVHCPCPFICELISGQRPAQFTVGQTVTFGIERGATFEPQGA